MGVQLAAALCDLSSRPYQGLQATSPEPTTRVEGLRWERRTGIRIARQTGLSRATISRILTGLKLNRMHDLEPPLPGQRYEHAHPGDLLDLDTLAKICAELGLKHRFTRPHATSACGHLSAELA